MRVAVVTLLIAATLAGSIGLAEAQMVSQVIKRVSPSVVVIGTKQQEVSSGPRREPVVVHGVGSGVLISPEGKVMTAAHVVQTADEISVRLTTGEVIAARVVASEPEADVALLQLLQPPPKGLHAKLGNSDKVQVGDEIFIVGAPYGIGHTVTVGHISRRHKPNTVYSGFVLAEFLQTDAAINQGNSGGPMFNLAGEVIGLVSHIISKSGGFEGIGFVVTSNVARRLLLEQKSFWTGLDGYVLSGDLAKAFNLPQPTGLLVQRIADRSPAAQLGLRPGTIRATVEGKTLYVGGDVILEVHGITITDWNSYRQIQEFLSGLRPGAEVTVTVLRAGQQTKLTGKLP